VAGGAGVGGGGAVGVQGGHAPPGVRVPGSGGYQVLRDTENADEDGVHHADGSSGNVVSKVPGSRSGKVPLRERVRRRAGAMAGGGVSGQGGSRERRLRVSRPACRSPPPPAAVEAAHHIAAGGTQLRRHVVSLGGRAALRQNARVARRRRDLDVSAVIPGQRVSGSAVSEGPAEDAHAAGERDAWVGEVAGDLTRWRKTRSPWRVAAQAIRARVSCSPMPRRRYAGATRSPLR
jgi:hypothetical protein